MKMLAADRFFDAAEGVTDQPLFWHYAVLLLLVVTGLCLRLWGLGDVGLHGDEETMALPVRHILFDGVPLLPSEMFYSRGMSQLYLMAASVSVFGESEWALRLPSAIVGALTPLVAWLLGRRYLLAGYCLGFAAALTFLPALVEASQTARFYIFYVLIVMLFAFKLLQWGDRQRASGLVAVALLFLLGLDYQALMVFSTAIFVIPMCTNYKPGKFYAGVFGLVLCVIMFVAHRLFTDAMYQHSTKLVNTGVDETAAAEPLSLVAMLAIGAAVVLCGFALRWAAVHGLAYAVAATSLVAALIATAAGAVTLGGALLLVGGMLYFRLSQRWKLPLVACAVFGGLVLAGIVLGDEFASGGIKAYVQAHSQQLSIWPFVIFFGQFPLASVAAFLMLIPFVVSFLRGETLPEFILLFLLAVMLPLVVVGVFTWYPPTRYLVGFVPFFGLVSFALVQHHARPLQQHAFATQLALLVIVATSVVFIRPADLAQRVGKGCVTIDNLCHKPPAHREQAQFIQQLSLPDSAIVIAEDILQQTYYLGRVDYWLVGHSIGRVYVRAREDTVFDIYTNTETLLTPEAVNAVFSRQPRPDIYIIGNPENFHNGRGEHLTGGLLDELQRWPSTEIFSSEDGSARIWRFAGTAENQATAM